MALRGDMVVDPQPIVKLFRITESPDSVFRDRNILPQYRNDGFSSLRVLNEVIPAGEARLLQLGLSIEGYSEGCSASDVMLFAAIPEFSSGDQIPFRQGYTLVK